MFYDKVTSFSRSLIWGCFPLFDSFMISNQSDRLQCTSDVLRRLWPMVVTDLAAFWFKPEQSSLTLDLANRTENGVSKICHPERKLTSQLDFYWNCKRLKVWFSSVATYKTGWNDFMRKNLSFIPGEKSNSVGIRLLKLNYNYMQTLSKGHYGWLLFV
jgi:hypothetical protein